VNRPPRPAVTLTLGGLVAVACLVMAPPGAQALASDCSSTEGRTDFNGDGYDDAAVGDPEATVAGLAKAGTVTVLLGDADGLIGEGGQRIVISRASFGDTPAAGDRFGHDVMLSVTGRNDRCADLVVGTPGADHGGIDAGLANVVSYRLRPDDGTPYIGAIRLTHVSVNGDQKKGNRFGSAVSAYGDGREGLSAVLVGAPGDDVGAAKDAGSVNGFLSEGGQDEGVDFIHQGVEGVPGTPQSGDRFGASLAVAPPGSGERTPGGGGVVIGAPGDTVSGRDGAGSVMLLQGRNRPSLLLSQSTKGVPGRAETGDGFGTSVALDSTTGTLAVGTPGEDAGRTSGTGSVTLFHYDQNRVVPGRAFSQGTAGVPGADEAGDRFGSALAFGHHSTTLLVGIPGEDVGRTRDAGAVQPVRLSSDRTLTFPAAITENAPGTAGSVRSGNRFGKALGSLSGRTEDILTVSSPYAAGGSVYVLSDGDGVRPRFWKSGAGASRFGWSVSN
jgi:hypothetical protein